MAMNWRSSSSPLGYHFAPSDEQLIEYLKRKVIQDPLPCTAIVHDDVDIYNFHPNELHGKFRESDHEKTYFFMATKRKHQNAGRLDRFAKDGFWRATGRPLYAHDEIVKLVARKSSFVFYEKNHSKMENTDWLMVEFMLDDEQVPKSKDTKKDAKDSMKKLDEWVLCSIYKLLNCDEKKRRKMKGAMLLTEILNDKISFGSNPGMNEQEGGLQSMPCIPENCLGEEEPSNVIAPPDHLISQSEVNNIDMKILNQLANDGQYLGYGYGSHRCINFAKN